MGGELLNFALRQYLAYLAQIVLCCADGRYLMLRDGESNQAFQRLFDYLSFLGEVFDLQIR